jgi:hypothetical protein
VTAIGAVFLGLDPERGALVAVVAMVGDLLSSFFKIVNSHADMLVPGWNESLLDSARSRVSCTRSSARSVFRHNEIAKARRLGTAASIKSRDAGLETGQPFNGF